jgi:hypothetical protein
MALLEVIEQELNRTVTRDSAAYSYRIAAGFQRNRDAHAAESQDGDGVTHTAAALDEAPNLPLVGKEPRD